MAKQLIIKLLALLLLGECFSSPTQAFLAPANTAVSRRELRHHAVRRATTDAEESVSRRRLIFQSAAFAGMSALLTGSSMPAVAAQRQSLDSVLYRILRVKEAVLQETRLIKSGKFKDVQRANVKLAVSFMIKNYRLNDAFVTASSYLDGVDRRVEAGQVGQLAVQNLQTILEYFDSSDVQNIKVCPLQVNIGRSSK